jgi:hypothetical protein
VDAALGLVVIAMIVGIPLGIAKWRRWEGGKALGRILAETGGQLVSYQELRCRRHGQEITFRRDRNENTTGITVPLPAGYPLSIDIRKKTLGSRLLASDVPLLELGDVQFDRAFAVEAAPTKVVEQLLGVRVRSFLLEHRECVVIAKDGRLQMSGLQLLPAAVAVEAIDLAAGIAGGIRDAFAALAAQAESLALAEGDSPYRPIAVESGPDLERAHAAEVDKLGALQRRAQWVQTAKMLALVVAAAGAIKLLALWNHR